MSKVNRMQNEKGFTLVVVLMVLVVLSVLTTAIIGVAANNSSLTRGERDDQSTFYIAEAGLNKRLAEIEEFVSGHASIFSTEKESPDVIFLGEINARIDKEEKVYKFKEAFGNTPAATTTVEEGGQLGLYNIISVGEIGNKTRTLKREISINFTPDIGSEPGENEDGENPGGSTGGGSVIDVPDGTAVFVNGNISMSGSATINGNIGTNKSGNNSLEFEGNPSINGSIYVPKGSENGAIKKPDEMKHIPSASGLEKPGVMKLPEFPVYPEYEVPTDITLKRDGNDKKVIKDGGLFIDNYISNNYVLDLEKNISLTNITLKSNYNLTINVGDSDKVIVVEHLDVESGHIKIIGTGKLIFLVKDKITMNGGSTINNGGSIDQLGIFLQESTDSQKPKIVNFGGSQKIFGSLYAQDADITLGNGAGFQGNIYTGGKNVILDGGVWTNSNLILAPNAHVKVLAGAKVTGAIYGDSFTASGGSSVTFGKPVVEPNPNLPDPGDPITPPTGSGSTSGTGHVTPGKTLEP